MAYIELTWKTFSVDLTKINKYFRNNLSSNYDGLVCSPESLKIMFIEESSQEDLDIVTSYWDTLTESSFDPTLDEIIDNKINEAIVFGKQIQEEFVKENVKLGITQLGLTNHVRKTLREVKGALDTGSVYDAVTEIKNIPPESLDNNILTAARLLLFRNKIEIFLEVPLATNWYDEETWL